MNEINKEIENTLSSAERIDNVKLESSLYFKVLNKLDHPAPKREPLFIFSPAFKTAFAAVLFLLNILTVYFVLEGKEPDRQNRNASVKTVAEEYFNYNNYNF